MSFRVSFKVSLGFHVWFFRINLWGFIYGFFRVQLGLHVGFLIRISLGCLWVSPRVSLNKETVKTGSKEAKEQEVEQQKHMPG